MAAKKDGNPKEYGELCPTGKVHTAIINGNTFRYKSVQYTDVDGMAMFEGDIVLGKVVDVDRDTDIRKQEMQGVVARGIVITGNQYRWPNCKVPYTIDPALPNQARVTDAIAHWEANTRFRFVLRTAANAATYPDWVTFRSGSGCSSYVGRQGGQQYISLASGCSKGNAIHEIGHTIGFWHEHSREDRNAFVTIHWDKIMPGYEHNFNQQIADGDDVGIYEYGSIMHYSRDAFSIDGSDTITPTDPSASIGQRAGLSPGDIAAANTLCPLVVCPAAPKVCSPAPLIKCTAAPKLCPPSPLQCAAGPNCAPAPKIVCLPSPVLKCPPAPKIYCGAAPAIKPFPGEEIRRKGYSFDPSTGTGQGGMNQIPQIVININFNGFQPPTVQTNYSGTDPYADEDSDWTASEYPDPGDCCDNSITDESGSSSGDFDPECSE